MKLKFIISIFILLFIVLSCSSEGTVISKKKQTEEVEITTNNNSDTYLEVNFLPESTARYLVREQLANLDFPNDAIGETKEINGSISIDKEGNIIKNKSNIIVNVQSLRSDSGRRDKYISMRSLDTNTYPEATISINKIEGLPWPLPKNGKKELRIVGDMSAHGVTSKVIWNTTINFNNNYIEGLAKTSFKFEKFEMDLPKVAIVLSVDNEIRLELEFSAEIIYLE